MILSWMRGGEGSEAGKDAAVKDLDLDAGLPEWSDDLE